MVRIRLIKACSSSPLLVLVALLATMGGCGRSERPASKKKESAAAANPPQQGGAPRKSNEPPSATANDPPEKNPVSATPPAPTDARLRTTSGPQVTQELRSSGAKATLINLWASWCGPCRREFPMLVGMKDNLKSDGVEVVFISVDEPETHPAAIEFAEQHGLTPPFLVAERPLAPLKQALHPDWPGMLPATFLFDKAGKMRYFWGGPVYEHEVLPVVEGLLRGENIDGETRYGLKRGRDYRED